MKVFICDGNWIAFRTFITRRLCTTRGLDTTVSFGILQDIRASALPLDCTHAIVCWDHPEGVKKRRALYPNYKAHRKESKQAQELDWDRYFASIANAEKLLPKLGIPSLKIPGMEGDDAVAAVVGECKRKDIECVVRSGDKDLIQLLDDGVTICNKDGVLDVSFFKKNGITRSGWIVERAIIGDHSDGIDGVRGIGEVRARIVTKGCKGKGKYLNYLRDTEFPNEGEGKYFNAVKNSLFIVKRNIRLIQLQTEANTPEVPRAIGDLNEPKLSSEVFKALAGFEMQSFVKTMANVKQYSTLQHLLGGNE